jgi:hypothetical protein
VKAYGKALPDDEIRSIMGRAIPPGWKVNLLALGKEPWKFRDLNDQLATYHQHWQSDQQNQIMIKMTGTVPGKSSNGKRKIISAKITTVVAVAAADAKDIMGEEVTDEDKEDAKGEAAEIMTKTSFKKWCVLHHYSTDCSAPKKHGHEEYNMVLKADSKNMFQSSLKAILSKKEKQKNDKNNMELEDESLDMNVFDKLMEGKHNEYFERK